ncbi:CGEA protein (plasmid) [Bacillus mycoides]|uniref:CGEA protein n=1 Tax=Bacillus mycoides TaxID=1405 RepID=UPI001C3335B6|nr:CGEA protein [Bacillus mycoides]QWH04100.1 CGEA protein [Bacillus mycoides]
MGTVVTITTRSGQIIGPAILQQFISTLCIVILEEEGIITPTSSNFIFISSEDIESVTLNT